jgi:DNA (cytosine-5)-methyltransferase 1
MLSHKMKNRKLTAIDLFSGCGGVTEGLLQAGFNVIAAIEIDPIAINTYQLNHPTINLSQKDIRLINVNKWMHELNIESGELDLLVGCPPCQGFSTLRTKNGAHINRDHRNYLLFDMQRVIEVFQPKTIIMENVPKLYEKLVFDKFKKELEKLGYFTNWGIVDAQNYSVPQRRKRLVLTAGKGFGIPFPAQANQLKTVRTAIGHLKKSGASGDALHDLVENRTAHIRKIIMKIPKDGGSRSELPKELFLECHKKFDGFKDVYGRMAWDKVAPTITGGCFNPSKGRFLHPKYNRNITMREAALLQTFPRNYKFDLTNGKQDIALLIGNALPPELIRRQAIEVKKTLITIEIERVVNGKR